MLNDPKFVREREAWFKHGLSSMAGWAALVVIVVSAVTNFAAAAMHLGGEQTAMVVMGANLIGIVSGYVYFEIDARKRARKGGVQIDEF